MDIIYFNHYYHRAQSWWDRRNFMLSWWRIYTNDPGWVSPLLHYASLRQSLGQTKIAIWPA